MRYRKWKPRNILDRYDCSNDGVMHKSHSCSYLVYHAVFTAKYRGKIFTNPMIIDSMGEYIKEICDNRKWPIHKLSIESDHVHIVVQLPPMISPMKAVKDIKTNTSRLMNLKYSNFQWSIGYWADTVGKANEDIIKKYVGEQGKVIV